MHVALYLGVDAKVIVQGMQILIYHNKIVGVASSNNYLDIREKSK